MTSALRCHSAMMLSSIPISFYMMDSHRSVSSGLTRCVHEDNRVPCCDLEIREKMTFRHAVCLMAEVRCSPNAKTQDLPKVA